LKQAKAMAKIVFIGDLVWDGHVARGGQAMIVLQWLHGLKRKGQDVLLLNMIGEQQPLQRNLTVQAFGKLIEEWWNPANTCLMRENESLYGLEISAVRAFVESADALFQFGIPGKRQDSSPLDKIRPRILLETDPGYTHLWAVGRSPEDIFGRHDLYLTVGGRIGKPECRIPTSGISWQPVWNPVVSSWWDKPSAPSRNRFTTVADWYSQGYLDFEGKVLGPKCDEFRKFLTLPEKAGESLEIALLISEGDPDIALFQTH
jgi:hypothetical protein